MNFWPHIFSSFISSYIFTDVYRDSYREPKYERVKNQPRYKPYPYKKHDGSQHFSREAELKPRHRCKKLHENVPIKTEYDEIHERIFLKKYANKKKDQERVYENRNRYSEREPYSDDLDPIEAYNHNLLNQLEQALNAQASAWSKTGKIGTIKTLSQSNTANLNLKSTTTLEDILAIKRAPYSVVHPISAKNQNMIQLLENAINLETMMNMAKQTPAPVIQQKEKDLPDLVTLSSVTEKTLTTEAQTR